MSKSTYMKETPEAVFTRIYKNGILPFLKETFEDASRASLFWNAMAYIAFIITACFSLEAAGVISGIGSLFLLAATIDEEFEKNPNTHYWPPLTFLFWVFILLACIFGIFFGLWYITIRPFNIWLNKPKAEHNRNFTWTTADGRQIKLKRLSNQHISNILWYLEVVTGINTDGNVQRLLKQELNYRDNLKGELMWYNGGNRLLWKPLPISREVQFLKDAGLIDTNGNICYNGHIIGSISHIKDWQTI